MTSRPVGQEEHCFSVSAITVCSPDSTVHYMYIFCVLMADSRAFPIPVGFLVGDICLGVGIIFLIVSIVQFFQSSKYLNANAVSSFYAQKKHRQSLGFLATTRKLMLLE